MKEKLPIFKALDPHCRPVLLWVSALIVILVGGGILHVDHNGPSVTGVMFFGSCAASFAAIGFWIGINSDWYLIPLQLFAFAATVGIMTTLSAPSVLEAILLLGIFGLIIVSVVALPILLFRFLKNGKLIRLQPGVNEDGDASYREAVQFTLVHLFVLTTATAVVIPVIQWCSKVLTSNSSPESFAIVTKLSLSIAVASILTVWSTMGRSAVLRTTIIFPIVIMLAAFNYFFVRTGVYQWAYCGILIVTWLEFLALLWCLRLTDYRFASTPRQASNMKPLTDSN